MTEAQWMDLVAQYARKRGWLVAHFRPALSGNRHMTPVQYDGAGFPDLVLVRKGEVIFAELKREVRAEVTPEQARWIEELLQVTPEQIRWIDELLPAEGVRVVVWRPSDWSKVEEWLR